MTRNKFLIYTSNLGFQPKSMAEVLDFAKETPKFYIANVELNESLADVKEGDNIFTKKGNSIFVIKTLKESLENLSEEDRDYVDMLTREYGLKKVNILGVSDIVRFGSWCKYSKPFLKEQKMKNNNSIDDLATKIKKMYMPSKAEGVRISIQDGSICVRTNEGYVSINENNELTSYPEEFTLDVPVFVVNKPKSQLVKGDIIVNGRSYAKVVKLDGDKITAISYTGTNRVIHTIKDFLFNQSFVQVVMSLAGNINGTGMNPMMMMALMGEDGKDDLKSLLPLMMMNQNNGSLGLNPMMLLLAKGGDSSSSMKDLLMMSMMSGNGGNPFNNLFGNFDRKPLNPQVKNDENMPEAMDDALDQKEEVK